MKKQQKQSQQAKLRQEQALTGKEIEYEDMHEKLDNITKQGMSGMTYRMMTGV